MCQISLSTKNLSRSIKILKRYNKVRRHQVIKSDLFQKLHSGVHATETPMTTTLVRKTCPNLRCAVRGSWWAGRNGGDDHDNYHGDSMTVFVAVLDLFTEEERTWKVIGWLQRVTILDGLQSRVHRSFTPIVERFSGSSFLLNSHPFISTLGWM